MNPTSKLETDLPPALPEGAVQRDILYSDVESFVRFDDTSFFNAETPPDHRPPNLTFNEVSEGLQRGDIIRGIYDAEGSMVAASWL